MGKTFQLLLTVSIAVFGAISEPRLVAEEIDFQRDIAPILEDNCWYCHGPDEQESGLRLDFRPRMLRGGDSGQPAVVPGKPEKSYIVEVINHVDPDMAMPPDEEKLSPRDIELLTRWIQQGAVWPGQMDAVDVRTSDHWSFQKVQRPEVPEHDRRQQPLDAFLVNRLQQKGLSFSAEADSRTLIRRASIVLTGLAPTQEQTAAFAAACEKDSEAAYANMVEDLLASPHFGERWAQHWLDVIRWAETNGSEANLYRKNAWIYRDYVVRAFNEDKPYDSFLREQIAGDSIGSGEATGFLVAGPHVPAATVGREPSAIRQARADRMDEVIQTVGASVMGLTMGCARCHNHKFDPVTIQDYYAMTGVFGDVEFGSRFPEFSKEHPRRLRGDEIWRDIATHRKQLRESGGWEENWGAYRELHFPAVSTTAVRIRFKMRNVGLDELEIFGTEDSRRNLAHHRHGTIVSGVPEKGVDGRFPIDRLIDGEYGTMTWRAQFPKNSDDRAWVQLEFPSTEVINRLRMSSNREYFYDTDYLDRKPFLPRYEFDLDIRDENGDWKPWVGTWHVNHKLNDKHPERKTHLAQIQKGIGFLAEEGPRRSFVGRFVQAGVTRVLHRGSPENPKDEVVPAAPAILSGDLGLTSEADGAKRRREFADWISSANNPLTARVMANRLWHHVFGQGLVTTTSDFGKAGAAPTHPELLDWLAVELVEPTSRTGAPWSMKDMIRTMVMSRAFRQSSAPRADALNVDGGSALLWRFPPKRVEAEVIRDSILQASGCLDTTIGGRSYRIHNEKKTYAQWQVVDNFGPTTWRRMLYQERMRRVDDRMFTAFDFPDCGQVRARRPVSTTPLQALNLMNSEFVMDQSQRIAAGANERSQGDINRAIGFCFQSLLCRLPDKDEQTLCRQLAEEHSLAMVCRALINSNEFAFLP